MNYRFMRMVLFFDLPVLDSKQRKEYRVFVKNIKKLGFYMLQESAYVKMCIDQQEVQSVTKNVDKVKPSEGTVFIINVTEKQFAGMSVILGDNITDVINNDERIVEL